MRTLFLLLLLALTSCAPLISEAALVTDVQPHEDGGFVVTRCYVVLETGGLFSDIRAVRFDGCEKSRQLAEP